MEDISKALRELAESNNKLIEKLDQVKTEILKDREARARKSAIRARNSMELDIDLIMCWRGCSRQHAIDKLKKHNYDVGRAVRGQMGLGLPDGWKEQILLHYEHKKNRQVMEGW